MSEQTKTQSFLEKLKKKAAESEKYNEEIFYEEAWIENKNCPNCWASRAKQDGLTQCAYCGFEFVAVELWNWIFIKKEDNSKK